MRRSEKEIEDKKVIESILNQTPVCRIGLVDKNIPYVVPMNFAYRDNAIYLHSALSGRKIDIIKSNNNVCFEAEVDVELVESENPCDWGVRYKSVIGFGKAFIIENIDDKREMCNILMQKYTKKSIHEFADGSLNKIYIIKIEIDEMTGKGSGY